MKDLERTKYKQQKSHKASKIIRTSEHTVISFTFEFMFIYISF